MKISTLHDLYIDELRDILDAENQILKAMPQIVKAVENDELKNLFEEHMDQTKEQVERLNKIFENAGVPAKGKKCTGMAGIIEECKQLIEEDVESEVLDAGIIACAQKIEHYEIASYGCVVTYAKLLGNEEDADLLQETLDEEKETDETLTDLAESTVNVEASESEEMEEEEPAKPRGKKPAAKR